jgi:hypothetical protein
MEGSMRRLTDEEVSRVQDVCRVLPLWKREEFLQELARRMQGREIGDADLRREAATAMRAVLGRGHAWVLESD